METLMRQLKSVLLFVIILFTASCGTNYRDYVLSLTSSDPEIKLINPQKSIISEFHNSYFIEGRVLDYTSVEKIFVVQNGNKSYECKISIVDDKMIFSKLVDIENGENKFRFKILNKQNEEVLSDYFIINKNWEKDSEELIDSSHVSVFNHNDDFFILGGESNISNLNLIFSYPKEGSISILDNDVTIPKKSNIIKDDNKLYIFSGLDNAGVMSKYSIFSLDSKVITTTGVLNNNCGIIEGSIFKDNDNFHIVGGKSNSGLINTITTFPKSNIRACTQKTIGDNINNAYIELYDLNNDGIDELLFLGGEIDNIQNKNILQLKSNEFKTIDTVDLSFKSSLKNAGFIRVKNKIYYFGGEDENGNISDNMGYFDLSQKIIVQLLPMPFKLKNMGISVRDNTIYLFGGIGYNENGNKEKKKGIYKLKITE